MKKIYDYIDSNRDKIIADLISLAKIPSISKNDGSGYIFGKEVDNALNHAASLFNQSGFDMKVKSDLGYAVLTTDGEGDGIGIFGHSDVVPVNDDWIKTSPFEPIEENGFLFGRGVDDNKAGVIASLYVLKALKECGIDIKSKITVFVGGSEETGMEDMEGFIKNEKMPEVCIVPDSDFPLSLGEKGIMHVDIKSNKAFEDITLFEGGKAYNVILDNVLVKLKNGEELTFKGITSHAAWPEGSANAAYKAANELINLDISENDKAILRSFAHFIEGYYGENLGIASEGAFNKLTCVNGIVKIEDGKLYFTLDIRYGNEVDSKNTIERIKQAVGNADFEVVSISDDPGFLLDEKGDITKIILSACREHSGIPDAAPFKNFGGTYARKLKNAYSIRHSVPFDRSSLDLPFGHGCAHQSDEALSIDAFLGGIKVLAKIIVDLDEHLTK